VLLDRARLGRSRASLARVTMSDRFDKRHLIRRRIPPQHSRIT